MSEASAAEFSEVTMEHARNPRNYGLLGTFNGRARRTGSCGDTMAMWVNVQDGILAEVAFVTDGCGTSRAAGSMTTALATGRPLSEVAAVVQQTILDALSPFPDEAAHCAELSCDTLHAACADFCERGGKQPASRALMVALPLKDGALTPDYDHCEQFALVEVEPDLQVLGRQVMLNAPAQDPARLPRWLAERGVGVVIGGELQGPELERFAEAGIRVCIGAVNKSPTHLVAAWLTGLLKECVNGGQG